MRKTVGKFTFVSRVLIVVVLFRSMGQHEVKFRSLARFQSPETAGTRDPPDQPEKSHAELRQPLTNTKRRFNKGRVSTITQLQARLTILRRLYRMLIKRLV